MATGLGLLALVDPDRAPADGVAVEVLVRPEQIELVDPATSEDYQAPVIGYEYFGHDAVIRLGRSGDRMGELVVRVAGGPVRALGERVGVRAHGPVQAWAATGRRWGTTGPGTDRQITSA